MKIILLKTIKGLGSQDDIVKVKQGFALNHLIPKNQAIPATDIAEQIVRKKKENMRKIHFQKYKKATALAKIIKQQCPIITREANQNNQLYSAISKKDITNALTSLGINMNNVLILIKNKIKTFGIHSVEVQLYHKIKTNVNINVTNN